MGIRLDIGSRSTEIRLTTITHRLHAFYLIYFMLNLWLIKIQGVSKKKVVGLSRCPVDMYQVTCFRLFPFDPHHSLNLPSTVPISLLGSPQFKSVSTGCMKTQMQ